MQYILVLEPFYANSVVQLPTVLLSSPVPLFDIDTDNNTAAATVGKMFNAVVMNDFWKSRLHTPTEFSVSFQSRKIPSCEARIVIGDEDTVRRAIKSAADILLTKITWACGTDAQDAFIDAMDSHTEQNMTAMLDDKTKHAVWERLRDIKQRHALRDFRRDALKLEKLADELSDTFARVMEHDSTLAALDSSVEQIRNHVSQFATQFKS